MAALDVLFVHNNFPAQFRNLAGTMARNSAIRVRAIGARTAPGLTGIETQRYSVPGHDMSGVHPFARRFEIESRRAEQVIYAANVLKSQGFSPKLIYVHPGWGEALPLRILFPDAAICAYAEFYYLASGTDVGFDKEFPQYGVDGETRVVLRNAATLLALTEANYAHWQRSIFPAECRPKIHVVHDGLDIQRLRPRAPDWSMPIGGQIFAPDDEIVTFVARSLEPYRGFHVFMRALPALLKARPRARICIMGRDDVSYGSAVTGHESWRAKMLAELEGRFDLTRVHFFGHVPYEDYLALLGRSSAHVYLTYPFVLSWSMLEAMALECLVIGSDTPPVAEVIRHGENGLLVPFFDGDALVEQIAAALAEPGRHAPLRRAARQTIVENYDFAATSWPEHLRLIEEYSYSPRLTEALRAGAPALA
jgi:glycosyltransferase involved in cell wall biosynthesis